ncbi:hypothetical protein SY88_03990 [Clostridiales bacterium PH28_bin88]|nr:hypothetical protein SY88_03990 [Clostridiales bacterium PH28_bin88]
MIRGIYTSALGMLVQQQRQDVVAQNLANANTPGYKRDQVVFRPFPEVLLGRTGGANGSPQGQPVGTTQWGVEVAEVAPVQQVGALEQTGHSTDLALAEEGLVFFTLQTPEGARYTRSGDFRVDADGYLVAADGAYVLGQRGPIMVENAGFVVTPAGEVRAGDMVLDTLMVTSFEEPGELRKVGDNRFMAEEGANPRVVSPRGLRQGALETSNVSLVTEMVTMVTGLRAYEANQRVLRVQDELLGRAVNDLGVVR